MTPTFYIFHGDDDLSIDEAVARLRAEMGSGTEAEMNISEFDGTAATPPEVINAVSSFPFLSDKRMVIVRGMIGWLTRKGAGQTGKDGVARLEEALPDLPDYARLIFIERELLKDKNTLRKLADTHERGFVRAFTAPKDTTDWIMRRAKSDYGAAIDHRAAMALSAVTGDDLRRADNELVKLVSYVDEGEPITEADVATLTPYVPEANIFAMVDALAEGRGQQALDMVHRLLSDRKQDPFGLYGMIVRQFRLLLLTREHLIDGSPQNLASVLKVKPFLVGKLTKQARQFTLEDLEEIYRALQETDLKMKTGRISPALALDLFIASVAR